MDKMNFAKQTKTNLKLNQNKKIIFYNIDPLQPVVISSFGIEILSSTPRQKGYKII
jgi:hypothetical protein